MRRLVRGIDCLGLLVGRYHQFSVRSVLEMFGLGFDGIWAVLGCM